MASVDSGGTADYYYDGWNRRIRKAEGTNTRNYFYSPQGLMLSEFRASTGWDVDYVYLNGLPIAKIAKHYESEPEFLLLDTIGDPPPPPGEEPYYDIFWFHNDHLGTPQSLTNKNKTVVWRGEYLPYGELYYEMVNATNDIRFPGQWHDRETNLYYNWHRYYQPQTGRYTQSDPIGLLGGTNMYAYVLNNSVKYADPWGLDRRQSFRERWWYYFKLTNQQTYVNFGIRSLIQIGGASATIGSLTQSQSLIQWIIGGFKGARYGLATFTALETGIIGLGSTALSASVVFLSYEAGIAGGSTLNATADIYFENNPEDLEALIHHVTPRTDACPYLPSEKVIP